MQAATRRMHTALLRGQYLRIPSQSGGKQLEVPRLLHNNYRTEERIGTSIRSRARYPGNGDQLEIQGRAEGAFRESRVTAL